VREVGLAMLTGGVVVLLFAAYQLWGTGIAEHDSQHRLAQDFRAAVGQSAAHAGRGGTHAGGASGSAPTGGHHRSSGSGSGSSGSGSARSGSGASHGGSSGADNPTVGSSHSASAGSSAGIPPGHVVAHLVIPSIDVNTYVVQGTADRDLAQGPGHYLGTPLPGQTGNAAIAGHRTTYGAPFYRLGQLADGARIDLTDTSGRTWSYQVFRRLVVAPADVSVLDPTKAALLTLTTCNPPFSATNRLVIRARLLGRAEAARHHSTTTPSRHSRTSPTAGSSGGSTAGSQGGSSAGSTHSSGATAPAANLGEGSNSAWPPTILWGLLFVLLWVGTRLAMARTRRGARLGAFAGGAILCAVPLWLCFHAIVHLLPANL